MTVRIIKFYRFSIRSLCLLFISISVNRSGIASILPVGILPQYLEVSVNHQSVSGFVEIWQDGDSFWLKVEDARKLQIDISDLEQKDGLIRLHSGDRLKLEYDALNQSLNLMVSASVLEGKTVLDNAAQTLLKNQELAPSVNGLTLNYSLYGQKGLGYETLSALSELRSTGGEQGVFSSSFNSRLQKNDGSTAGETQRLNTSWTYSDPERRLSLVIGDNYTDSLSWSQSIRFGGLTISKDYSLQPSVNPQARSVLTDRVALPSTVDLYINGVESSSQKVSPGQFVLSTVPTFTGGGMAEVVVTDINGRRRTVSLDVYGTQNMLAVGFNTWSFSLGWLRENYAESSFDYNPYLLSSGTWRYGVSNSLTLEAHTEMAQSQLFLGGAGLSWLTSPLTGIINLNFSESQYQSENGQQHGIGWQWNRGGFGISANHQHYSSLFCGLYCLAEGTAQEVSNSIWFTLGTEVAGNFGLGFVEQQSSYAGHSRYGSLSWTRTFNEGVTLSLSTSEMKSGNERQNVFYTGLSIPFGSRYRASFQGSRENGKAGAQWQLSSQMDRSEPDWGWMISGQQSNNNLFHAEVSRVATTHEWQVGTDVKRGGKNSYAMLDGTLGWLDGHVYAMRNVPDSFAIVDTSGVPDVPVLLHNNAAGVTDDKGYLLLTDLNGWIANRVAIDPLSLPGDYRAPDTVIMVIPRARSGVRVHFNVYRAKALLLRLKNTSGEEIGVGSSVTVLSKDGTASPFNTIVGYNGEVYLENPPTGGRIEVLTQSGKCIAKIPDTGGDTQSIKRVEAICY